jgi:myo-inositol-1(or 4)-monophosphatase
MHFCCSVGVLRHATPVAGVVIEFVGGGPGGVGGYVSRKFTAARNRGAFLDGKPLQVSGTRKLEDALVVGQS